MEKRPQLYRMSRSVLDWTKLFSTLLIWAALLVGGHHFFVRSSYFHLQKVEIRGDFRHVTLNQVEKLASPPYGKNLFAVSLHRIQNGIKRHPWIHEVQVRRQFPGSLIISVTEQEPFAAVAASNEFYLMNRQGDLFKKSDSREASFLPVITGFETDRLRNFPRYYRPKVREAYTFLNSFLNDPVNASFAVGRLHYSITEGIGLTVEKKEGGPPMELTFGKISPEEGMNHWRNFVSLMNREGLWFESVDLRVLGKAFAKGEKNGA